MTPTSTGWSLLLAAVGAFVLGEVAGDNVVLLVGAVLAAPLFVDVLIGRNALAGATVRRVLPSEVFAERPASGAFVVTSPRARSVRVRCDGGAEAVARGGSEETVRTSWRFPQRGRVTLPGFELATRWPLGLFERRVRVEREVTLLVAPTPRGWGRDAVAASADDLDEGAGRGPLGELADLRPYTDGDRVRSIHWPTTARVGEEMVAVRTRGVEDEPFIRVPRDAPDFERALQDACRAVLEQRGRYAVDLAGRRLGPDGGPAFRRLVLAALAEAS